jgi:hypothetical protein
MSLFDIWRDLKDMIIGTALPDAVNAVTHLLAEFGLSFRVLNWRLVQGQSEYIRLGFERDPMGVVLLYMAPLNYRKDVDLTLFDPKGGGTSYYRTVNIKRNIALSAILQVLAPDVQFEFRYVRSSRKMREEVERQVRLLIQYCRPMLEGDFSAWSLIIEFIQAMGESAESQTIDKWSSIMKQILTNALEKKDYALASQACSLLRRYRVELTCEEMDGCRLADQELEKMQQQ